MSLYFDQFNATLMNKSMIYFFTPNFWMVAAYYYDFWRSCDTEDWSNEAENTALINAKNDILLYIHIQNYGGRESSKCCNFKKHAKLKLTMFY